MTVVEPARPGTRIIPPPRLLADVAVLSRRDHLDLYGPDRRDSAARLIAEVERAGLRGRGGAGFPTAIKMRAVRANARRSNAVVVANGTESEPASSKDKVLMTRSPHLVLDGMVAAALSVGADRAVLCVERRHRQALLPLHLALEERGRHDPVPLRIAETPSRYTAGEETALVSWLNGGTARPAFAPPRPSDRGVDGAPTLVDNVETLAHLALIARFGADHFRQVGTPEEPGTVLVTVTGAARSSVQEVATGTEVGAVLERSGLDASLPVLVGGYFGTWLEAGQARQASLSSAGLRPFEASLGCGLLASLPGADRHCPLQEIDRVLRWLAANSAGQCGPCVNGLPALSHAFSALVAGDREGRAEALLDRWSPMVAGRGACKMPDGAVRLLVSSRRAFAEHIAHHKHFGPCPANTHQLLPTPALEGWR